MATIQLNNNDLRVMIREAVERLCEGQWYEAEPLCRLPYYVSVNFSDHAIEREYEREISEDRVVENLKKVIKKIIEDYELGMFGPGERIKVIDQDSCIVTVCGINPSYNKKRINQLVVVTCFVWDGRINVETGNFYYINQPSIDFLEAQKWNEENQDKVKSYQEWKRGYDLVNLDRKADKEYLKRKKEQNPGHARRMEMLRNAYAQKAYDDKQKIHDALPDGDLDAIRDYYKDVDSRKIELEPIYEIARKATKQALQEAFRDSTSKNPSTTKKPGKNGFYA